MSSEEIIFNYLKDTYSIRSIKDTFSPLSSTDNDKGGSLLAPWSVDAISINTDIEADEIISVLSEYKNGSISASKQKSSGSQVFEIYGELPLKPSDDSRRPCKEKMTVSELMNLYLYQYSKERIAEHNYPIRIEEALFEMKNSVFLPDDFIPPYLLGAVEGKSDMGPSEVKNHMQLTKRVNSLYVYPEDYSSGHGKIRFIYPARSGNVLYAPSNEKIRMLLSDSFQSLGTSEEYADFVNSRLVKNVIYTITQKGTRELKRPLFDDKKIEVLNRMGLVGGPACSPVIKDGVTTEQLEEIYDRQKKSAEQLATKWLDTLIKVER